MHTRIANSEFGRSRRSLVAALAGVALLASAGALGGHAQTSAPAGATQPATFAPAIVPGNDWLRVTAERVHLRSRGDANSLAVARVDRGTILRGVDEAYGWRRILPPPGTFSYVAAAYVERLSATEGRVKVQSGTLRVRVGSLEREVNPLETEVQAQLERDTRVQIVGQQGEWLKIAPPPGVFFYVADEYVTRIGDDEPEVRAAAEAYAAGTTTAHPAPPQRRAETPATWPARRPDAPDLTGAWGRQLTEVEAAIQAEAARSPLQADWGVLIDRLRPIAQQREEPMVARLADAWIVQLRQRTVDQETARAADAVMRRAARDRAEHEREMERLERARAGGGPQSRPTSTQPAATQPGAKRPAATQPGPDPPAATQPDLG